MPRKFDINSLFIVYWIFGIILAFLDLRVIGSSGYAGFVSSSLPVVEALSQQSASQNQWRGYYVTMVTLMFVFLPPLWLACERERRVVNNKYSKSLTLILVLLCLMILWGLTQFHDGIDNVRTVNNAYGKHLLLIVMMKYRIGLAVFGSAVMTGYFVPLFIVAVVVPQALLYKKK